MVWGTPTPICLYPSPLPTPRALPVSTCLHLCPFHLVAQACSWAVGGRRLPRTYVRSPRPRGGVGIRAPHVVFGTESILVSDNPPPSWLRLHMLPLPSPMEMEAALVEHLANPQILAGQEILSALGMIFGISIARCWTVCGKWRSRWGTFREGLTTFKRN